MGLCQPCYSSYLGHRRPPGTSSSLKPFRSSLKCISAKLRQLSYAWDGLSASWEDLPYIRIRCCRQTRKGIGGCPVKTVTVHPRPSRVFQTKNTKNLRVPLCVIK